jgi:hypothetical protein
VHEFFDRPPNRVARDLVGKLLKVGRIQGTILAVLPQTAKDNERWLDSRPLFGPDAADAYVAPYRGHHMLFLRTGARSTCVRIDQISIRGHVFVNPSQVCSALGLGGERSGSVSFDGQLVRVRW